MNQNLLYLAYASIPEKLTNISTSDKFKPMKIDSNDKNPFPQPTFQLEEQSEFFILFRHIWAILYQRLKLSYRDIRSLCCQILLPAIFTLIGLWILSAGLSFCI